MQKRSFKLKVSFPVSEKPVCILHHGANYSWENMLTKRESGSQWGGCFFPSFGFPFWGSFASFRLVARRLVYQSADSEVFLNDDICRKSVNLERIALK